MSVASECNPDANAVTLNITAGQKLRHRIEEDDGVRFELVDHASEVLLEDSDPRRERLWPLTGDDMEPRPCIHSLGMVFDGAGALTWAIDIVSSTGQLVSEVKHCKYRNSGDTVEFFAALDIFIG
jgi:hypothetical protein